jgi:hypothetical protein
MELFLQCIQLAADAVGVGIFDGFVDGQGLGPVFAGAGRFA